MTATSNAESQVPGTEDTGLATAQLLQQVPTAQPVPADTASDGQEEDAIAAYMAELLQRHNPDGTPAIASQPQAAAPVEAVEAEPAPETLQPRVPVAPPERRDDLAVMRELANSTAKNALDAYSSSRLVKTTRGRFQIAAVSIAISITLAYLSSGVTSLAFIGSIVCFTVAVLWTSRYLLLVKHLGSLMGRPGNQPQLATEMPEQQLPLAMDAPEQPTPSATDVPELLATGADGPTDSPQ